MPIGNSDNAGAWNNQSPTMSRLSVFYMVDPTVTSTLVVVGAVVEMEGFTPPTSPGDGVFTPPLVKLSATTVDNLLLGVIIGGPNLGTNPVLTPAVGYLAEICVKGMCKVQIDATTAVGNSLIQSTTTAGTAHPGAAVVNQTLGTALQAVTFVSGVTLANAWVNKV